MLPTVPKLVGGRSENSPGALSCGSPWRLLPLPAQPCVPVEFAPRISALAWLCDTAGAEGLPLWGLGQNNYHVSYKHFNLFEGKCMGLSMPFIYLYALLICRIYIFMF